VGGIPEGLSPQRVRDVLDRLVEEGHAVSRVDGSTHQLFPVAIDAAEGEALREWVRQEGASNTIEIGLGYGIAALFICEALLRNGAADPHHLALDPNQETRFASCGLQFLNEAGVADLIEFHPNPSEIILPRLLAEGRSFDLAFVDGNHRFDGVFLDLIYLGRLVRNGGIIFVDDYQLAAIARAVAFCTTNLQWTIEEVSARDPRHQWTVLRTAPVPPQRGFDYFVDF
jgi:predicted O-methyltransferase YrrM